MQNILVQGLNQNLANLGYEQINVIQSTKYNLYFYRIENVVIVFEEAHSNGLTGKINQCYICCFFKNIETLKNELTKIAVEFKFGGVVSGRQNGSYRISVLPMYGIDNLLDAVKALLNLKPAKGTTNYWSEEELRTFELTID